MADERRERDAAEEATGGSPHYAPHNNGQQGPDNGESVVADDDLAMRGAGPAGESAGSGVPGLGGSPGGTPNSGGVGLPGGNRRLGAGRAKTSDASLGSTPATGGLGTGGNARSGHGQTPSSDVLPGGATRSTANTPGNAPHTPNEAEKTALEHADQGTRKTGAMMNDPLGSAAANDIPTHGDAAATRLRGGHGARNAPRPPGPDTPVPDTPQYDVNNPPAQNAASRPTPENPIPEQPAPGLMDRPGPEAEI
ncbi:MAG TPA: hypothetical protein VKT52_08165 [Ktedonobacterales bacterium]|nr:hypothetical protein [Ktedonobacterales bacterium]